MLLMQSGKAPAEFKGRYELQLTGTLEGKPWTWTPDPAGRAISVKQYARVEGTVDHPQPAVVKTVQVKVLDSAGGVRATQTVKM
jgi:hypothetical protein